MNGSQPPLFISVIIPHLNHLENLAVCLKSLAAQTFDPSRFEVIVIDNGSTTRPDAIIGAYPGMRLLEEQEPGPARNTGVRASKGDVLAFIDADCVAHPDWLKAVERAVLSAPEDTIFGGRIDTWQTQPDRLSDVEAYETILTFDQKKWIEKHKFCGTANLVVRRSTFNKVGFFGGITIAEDLDWGHRANMAGLPLRFVPDMVITHPPRQSLRELKVKWRRHVQHDFNTMQTRSFWRLRWLFRTLLVLVSPLLHFPMVITSPRAPRFSDRWKAFLVLVQIRLFRVRTMLGLMISNPGIVWNRDSAV
jgi:GT2 family glycosyltransferase